MLLRFQFSFQNARNGLQLKELIFKVKCKCNKHYLFITQESRLPNHVKMLVYSCVKKGTLHFKVYWQAGKNIYDLLGDE